MSRIVLVVALPLLTAFLLPIVARFSRPAAQAAGPLVLVVMAWLVGDAWLTQGSGATSVAIGGFLPPLGIVFYVDELALLFALAVPVMTLLLWPWDGKASGIQRQSLTLLLAASCSGLALSGDLFNLYVFYELTAVASYGLAADRGTPAGFAAAFRYLIVSALGSVLALVGIALIYFSTGTINLAHLAVLSPELNDPVGLAAFLCLLVGLGVKAELFPVNAWVPEVYGAASRRVAGLLAGLVSKLAVLVLLRVLLLVFPQQEAHQAMLVLGMLGVLSGEFAAWRARDLTRMLAWSSIGQLGIVFVGFSVSGEAGVVAGLAVALHHLVVKPALFLIAERWGGSLDALDGAARVSPLAAALFVLFALSLVGVPPLPGFWAKFLVLSGLAGEGSALALLGIAVILVTTVVEANYLFRTAARLYSGQPAEPRVPAHGVLDLSTATLLGGVLILTVVTIEPVWDGLSRLSHGAADVVGYVATVSGRQGEVQ